MHPDVKVLLDLQELDKEVIELNSILAKYPQIWEETKKKVQAKREAIAKAEAALDRHNKERKRVEQKLRMYSDDLRKFQQQTSAIKTPKEYEALNKQIEAVKGKIALLEEQGVTLIDGEEGVKKAVDAAKADAEEFEAFARKEKGRIREQFNEKKSRLTDMEAERSRMAAKIDPEALALYDRISKRHPGSAIVTVRNQSCSGCHFSLLPDILVSVHRQDKIVTCPNCGRILAYDENYAAVEESAVG